MPRLLLRPGWILTHLAVVAIAITFISLGMWQLDRHEERQADNVHISAAAESTVIPLDQAMAQEDPVLQPATATGTFEGPDVRLAPRSRNELPGFEVLTPLRLDDGRTLLVNRGWVPLDDPIPPAPTGVVAVDGRVRQPAAARQVLRTDDGEIELVSNPDTVVLAEQVPDLIDDVYLEVVDETARNAGVVPRPAEPVALDDGNHLSYAMQWFAFTVIGLIGYPLLLRRRIADEAEGGDDAPTAPGGGADVIGKGLPDDAPAGAGPSADVEPRPVSK